MGDEVEPRRVVHRGEREVRERTSTSDATSNDGLTRQCCAEGRPIGRPFRRRDPVAPLASAARTHSSGGRVSDLIRTPACAPGRDCAASCSTSNRYSLMTRVALVLCAIALAALAPAAPSPAQDHHPSHASEKLGTVHFATSCAPAVAPRFDRAVALLHSFEFGAAIRAFDAVLAADSTCAMAHWGIALSRWSNPMAAVNAHRRASSRRAVVRQTPRHASERRDGARARLHRGRRRALSRLRARRASDARVANYERAMADLVARQPADTEAKIFHAIALVATAAPTDKTLREAAARRARSWSAVGGAARPPGARALHHPHLRRAGARRAGRGRGARGTPTSRPRRRTRCTCRRTRSRGSGTWERIGRARTGRRTMRRCATRRSAKRCTRRTTWMYAYLQMRQYDEARAVRDDIPALAARFDPTAVTRRGARLPPAFFAIAAIPARFALERGAWAEAAALIPKRPTTRTPRR